MKKQIAWGGKQKIIWGLCLVAAWCLIGLVVYRTHGGLTVEGLVNYRPESPFVTALVMLGLFLLKSVDFIMHSGVLYAANGVMFPLPAALGLNLLGAAIMITPVYFVGRALGAPVLEELKKKYPRLNAFVSQPLGGELLLSLLLRSTGIALHVGSLYLGAARTGFGRYMLGSLLGLLPVMIPYTMMGTSANDLTSPLFLCSVAAEAVVSVLSLLAALLIRKRAQHKIQSPDTGDAPGQRSAQSSPDTIFQ